MNTKKLIETLIKDSSPRQKEFLEERFGLRDNNKKTLQELGDRYDITRERVRQIEAEGLKFASKNFSNSEGVKLVEKAIRHLEAAGGVKEEIDFVSDLKNLWEDDSLSASEARFIFVVAKKPLYYIEDENFFGFWYLDKETLKKAEGFISKAVKFFATKKEELISKNKFDELLDQLTKTSGLKDQIAVNYLSVSKKFGRNPFNDFGLSHWEEINPKTARAKAYLVLKKHGKPLHFKEIADMINKVGFNKKQVYAQTIHNELIKDSKFVLVGRGMYALKEYGYVPGTAKEVIQKVLKEKGPLHPQQILEMVGQQRFLKENTILLNLQNKKHFKKLPDGKYHIA